MIKKALLLLIVIGTACGFYVGGPKQGQNRIVGGQNLTDDEIYPFMVSIRYLSFDTHACGGAIIAKRTVLTAAHCIDQAASDNIVIIAGTNYWNKGGTRYRVQELITHPGYNVTVITNDVGLVIVNREIIYTSTVQPIKYSTEFISGGEDAFFIGWGMTSYQGQLSENLKYLGVKTLSNSDCARQMGEYDFMIFNSSLCMLAPAGESICNSDSGSPVIHDNKLIGMISWGYIVCGTVGPSVNARVSSYSDWIQANLVE